MQCFHLSWGKILPAIIFLATAWQLLSDRIHVPWVPLSWASGGNSDVAAAYAAPPAPHVDKAEDMAEGYAAVKLPFGSSPVVANSCYLQPGLPLDYFDGILLTEAGAIGSDKHVTHTSQECWESCKDWPGCVSWYWCDQMGGCKDAYGKQYPYKGCELRAKEAIRQLGQVPENWRLPTFATGFMKPVVPAEQVGQFTMNKRGSKILPKPTGGLIMTTSIHDKPCAKAQGDFINALSVINKIDYARLHGYEFALFTHVVDKSLPKLYSKVGLLRKLLAETSRERAEWILWVDADTLIQEMAFQMPLHAYADKSFVAWGDDDALVAGDPRNGVNTGILLLRNDKDYSTRFWRDIALVSRINQQEQRGIDTPEGRIKGELEDQTHISTSFEDLCDQNVIVYLLRTNKSYRKGALLEDGRYCMSCWFKDIPNTQAHAPFVNHFAACQMCTEVNPMMVEDGGADNEWSRFCHSAFMENFAFANRTMSQLLGCEQELVQWGPPLGLPLNEWFDCKGKQGHPTCPPLPPKQ